MPGHPARPPWRSPAPCPSPRSPQLGPWWPRPPIRGPPPPRRILGKLGRHAAGDPCAVACCRRPPRPTPHWRVPRPTPKCPGCRRCRSHPSARGLRPPAMGPPHHRQPPAPHTFPPPTWRPAAWMATRRWRRPWPRRFRRAFYNPSRTRARAPLVPSRPHAATTFTTFPTSPEFQFDNAPYRTLLLRRLRLALGLAPAHCRCGRAMDAYGDHRAACATSGALRARAVPIERALARIFREAGARVHMHVPLANMNFDPPPADARAIEILAQGLPLYQGAQLAVDATLVSPVGRDGTAHPHTTTLVPPSLRPRGASGCLSTQSSSNSAAAASSLLAWKSVAAGAKRRTPSSTAWRWLRREASSSPYGQQRSAHTPADGPPCSAVPPLTPSPQASLNSPLALRITPTATRPHSPTSSPKREMTPHPSPAASP